MCFLKITHQEVQMNSAFQPIEKRLSVEEQSQSTDQESNLDFTQFYHYLDAITSINLGLISTINQSLSSNMEKMKEMENSLDQMLNDSQKNQAKEDILVTSLDPMLKKMFGQNPYKFKLGIVGKPHKILYKERNFDLKIVLKNEKGEIIKNGMLFDNSANPIPLYFGVMTKEGQWVEKNQQGQDMVKGLSQIDLIHGEATFSKIHIKEISSYYPKKKLHFVIYPKESLLRFSNCTNLEKIIQESDIRPLIIKDITILSKKK